MPELVRGSVLVGVQGLGFRVLGLKSVGASNLGVWGLGFRSLGFRVWGLGLRVPAGSAAALRSTRVHVQVCARRDSDIGV